MKKKNLEKQLKEAIKRSGLSQYQLSRQANVDQSQISYFVSGKRSMTLKVAAKIPDVLGLELRQLKKQGVNKMVGRKKPEASITALAL